MAEKPKMTDRPRTSDKQKVNDLLAETIAKVKELGNAETVIGNPINTDSGTTIIPISKISMGFASGGLDYNGKDLKATTTGTAKLQNFGGGGGTGLSVVPVGFLVVSKNGDVSMINVGDKIPSDPVEQIIDVIQRSPEIIDKIKSFFKKDAGVEPDAPYKEEKTNK